MHRFFFLALLSAGVAQAQIWQELGPGPAFNGQVEGIQNREVVGAVNALTPHPTDPNILYIGAVNGGVWRTSNATAASPSWTRLSDNTRSLSVAALEFDPTDAQRRTLVAAIGNTSSLSRFGGEQFGALRTTDGGTNWTVLDNNLTGLTGTGVAPRGNTIVLSATTGIFRSTDAGVTFTEVSVGNGSGATGLPDGNFSDLASDATDATRLFAPAISVSAGGSVGVYRSNNSGGTWSKVSDAALDAVLGAAPRRAKIVLGLNSSIFVAVVSSTGRLSAIFRSGNLGTSWTNLGVPTTVEGTATQGIHPGGQGAIHLSLAADPLNDQIVYIGGDRQPLLNEGGSGGTSFPNSLGAQDFSGRLFRGDASQPLATRYTSLTHSGTENNSSPHADSRDLAFALGGELLEADDGGVYRRTNPRSSAGRWLSMNGDLKTTEYHSFAYDRVSDRVIGGAQDTGTTEQTAADNTIFNSVQTADGGDVTVDDISTSGQSFRYSSFQNLGSFRRRTCDVSGTCTGTVFVTLTPVDGSPAVAPQFYTPLTVNAVNGARLLVGASNGIYESADRGGTVTRPSTLRINAFVGSPIVYGVPGNAEYLLVGVAAAIHGRTAAGPLTLVNTLGETVADLAVDPGSLSRVFALTANTVQTSTNAGGAFSDITGNLLTLRAGTLRSMVFVPNADPALVVGGNRGVYVSRASTNYSVWSRLGSGMPNALVFELQYDQGRDFLAAGTLGRGAWKLRMAPALVPGVLFRNGFEQGGVR